MAASSVVLYLLVIVAVLSLASQAQAGTCAKPYWDIPALKKFCTCFNGFITCKNY